MIELIDTWKRQQALQAIQLADTAALSSPYCENPDQEESRLNDTDDSNSESSKNQKLCGKKLIFIFQ